MYQALYRKWRPVTFADVVGQEHITRVLSYEVAHDKISHAYLFCGSRGTGKTTCAKILAKAANCERPIDGDPCGVCPSCLEIYSGRAVDILEMDAASNTGVDYIRDIREEVTFTPTSLKTRVYIIDEVHMLSDGAFNALLKTLEEPPEQVIFILATTEVHKIPTTIISRCQRFDFRRISGEVIAKRLLYIASNEGINIDSEAAHLIARLSQGGMRDAISLLELCAGTNKTVDRAVVESVSGGTGRGKIERAVRAVADRDGGALFEIVAELYDVSGDIGVFWQDLISYYRDMLAVKTAKLPEATLAKGILDLTESEFALLKELSARFTLDGLLYHSKLLEDAYAAISRGVEVKRQRAEMTLLRLTLPPFDNSYDALAARVAILENNQRFEGEAVSAKPVLAPKTTVVITPPVTPKFAEAPPPKPTAERSIESHGAILESGAKLPYWNDALKKLKDTSAAITLEDYVPVKRGSAVSVLIEESFTYELLSPRQTEAELLAVIKTFDPEITAVAIELKK